MKFIIFLILLTSFLFSQDWKTQGAIWTDWDHQESSSDSVYFHDDYIWIAGADTINIFIPEEGTNGVISYWGFATNTDGQTDTIYIKAAPYRGDGSTLDADFTPVYQTMSTTAISANSKAQFEGFFMANSTLKDSFSSYINLMIYGVNNKTRKIWIKIERSIAQ